MAIHTTPASLRAWRDAFGPGFVTAPSEQTLRIVTAAGPRYKKAN